MLKELRDEKTYDKRVKKLVEKLELKGFNDVKADLPDCELPAKLINQADKTEFVPDITAMKDGRKCYFEIAQKNEDVTRIAGKWKLLSRLAEIKEGVFKIYVPHGHMAFTKNVVDKHKINTEIQSI